MAIELSVKLNNGIEIPNAYYRINHVNLDSISGKVFFQGALYSSKEAREQERSPVTENYYNNSFITDDKTGNLVEQSYLYIKTLANEYEKEKSLFANGRDI